jgi:predicted alpha/beta-hydrolase family hydrolase
MCSSTSLAIIRVAERLAAEQCLEACGTMPSSEPRPVSIAVSGSINVSGLLLEPAQPRACFVFAHGAGAGMTHPFLASVAAELWRRDIATLRYQFPYLERGGKRPDPPGIAQSTVRAAVAEAARLMPDSPLFAGGKSFGGRMTSQAQAAAPLQRVRGLIFLGFPLHPAGRPSHERGQHLFDLDVPLLFLQGTRDALAAPAEIVPLCRALGDRATLKLFEDADHSFRVPKRSGRTDAEVRVSMMDAISAWIDAVLGRPA